MILIYFYIEKYIFLYTKNCNIMKYMNKKFIQASFPFIYIMVWANKCLITKEL